MTRRRIALVALATVSVLAAGCTPSANVPDATRSPGEQPTPGGRVIYGSPSDIQGLNPVISADATSASITGLLYDTLVRPDPKTGEPIAWMGKWALAPDNLTYTWEIDPKADWSDGRPILADDWVTRVKATARSRLAAARNTFGEIEGFNDYADGKTTVISGISVDTANPKKFTARLVRPLCATLLGLFGAAPIPTHVFSKYTVDNEPRTNLDAAPENRAPTVFSGPFKFKEWREGDQVVLTRNENYWRGAPYLDEFVLKVVTTAAAQATQLKSGGITAGLQPPAQFDDLSKQQNLKAYEWRDNAYDYIGWRVNNPRVSFLQDKRIRQALAYGLDTAQAVQSILFGHGQKQVSHHPTASWAAAASGLDDFKYDPAKAEQLIRDAGFTKGADGFYQRGDRTLALTIVTNQGNAVREAFLNYAAEQYKTIGVKVTPKVESLQTLVPKLATGSDEIEAMLVGWQLGPDPDMYSIWHSASVPRPTQAGNNFVGFGNRDLDDLIERGRGPSCGRDQRRNIYAQANRLLNEEQPYNFGFSQNRILFADNRIRGIDPGGHSPNATWNIEKWWIKR
ncbi:MAG: ABC transporter substrate-binding protein [Candidatus Limnocylindria bacterium]